MSDHVLEIEDTLTARYIGTTFYVAFLLDSRSVFNFTANATTDVITTDSVHDYILNTKVRVDAVSGSTLPTPLAAGTDYYVRDASGSDLKLSLTYGGSAINITSAGTGSFTITDVALDNKIRDVANYIRKEVASYEGVTNRPSLTFTGDIVTTDTEVTLTQDLAVSNVSGVDDILLDALLVIRSGSAIPLNTSGTPTNYQKLLAEKSLEAGQAYSLRFPIIIPIPEIA